MSDALWTQSAAIEMCIVVEAICPEYGAHVALTGGTLYKLGERKDCDIAFYRIRQTPKIDRDGLIKALATIGFYDFRTFGWMSKSRYKGASVDIFFPEHIDVAGEDGSYH